MTVKDSRNAYIFDAISAQNADMMFKFASWTIGIILIFHVGYNGNISFGVHLPERQKNNERFLLHHELTFGRVALPPRKICYYKVWFDKYNAGRNLQWRDTYAL